MHFSGSNLQFNVSSPPSSVFITASFNSSNSLATLGVCFVTQNDQENRTKMILMNKPLSTTNIQLDLSPSRWKLPASFHKSPSWSLASSCFLLHSEPSSSGSAGRKKNVPYLTSFKWDIMLTSSQMKQLRQTCPRRTARLFVCIGDCGRTPLEGGIPSNPQSRV